MIVGHLVHVRIALCSFRTRIACTGHLVCLYYTLCTYVLLGVFIENVWVAWYVCRHVLHVRVASRTRVVGLVWLYQPRHNEEHYDPAVTIDGTELTSVKSFCYLGSVMSFNGSLDDEITQHFQGQRSIRQVNS